MGLIKIEWRAMGPNLRSRLPVAFSKALLRRLKQREASPARTNYRLQWLVWSIWGPGLQLGL